MGKRLAMMAAVATANAAAAISQNANQAVEGTGKADIPNIALSVRQPWAWAIIHGGKDIENRSAAAVRHGMKPGRIAIHASKGMTQDEYLHASNFMEGIGVKCPHPSLLVRGAVIGSVTVVEVVKESRSPWFFGPCGLVLKDPAPVRPMPAVGALGYFQWEHGGYEEAPKPWMVRWGQNPEPKLI